ncbi:hypothetical protein IP79_10330 [Porphyrobacter sp. AAP60]|nr:hypothetical protein IP79_10330 [Porphyrobacter sp. AAP60]
MDYGVPLALYHADGLARLVTDLHFEKPHRLKQLQRYSSGIPSSLVSRNNTQGLAYRAVLSHGGRKAWPHIKIAEEMAARSLKAVRETGADIVYGFDTAMLPSLDRLRDEGVMIVLEQCIAPRAQFIEAMSRMRQGIERRGLSIDLSDLENEISFARIMGEVEQAEWAFADRIYCPSGFVADAVQSCGIPTEKTRIVPYGVTVDTKAAHHKPSGARPRVTFCGRFSWRKGALEYGALAAALRKEADFEVLGSVALPEDVIAAVAVDVRFQGHLNRADYRRTLAQSDVMVLPSYSEGSATVVYEAMALGVPCVVSAESGSVITHGEDGMIVKAGDEEQLIATVAKLLCDPAKRRAMGQRAAVTAQSYTRENYGHRLVEALREDFAAYEKSARAT